MIFTRSVEGGIEPFAQAFTVEAALERLEFLSTAVESDNVESFVSESAIYQQPGPIFLKFHELWCGHCKRLKKHYAKVSNAIPDVKFIEVECSKNDATKAFCEAESVTGYPTLKYLSYGGAKPESYDGARTYDAMADFLLQKVTGSVEETSPTEAIIVVTTQSIPFASGSGGSWQ